MPSIWKPRGFEKSEYVTKLSQELGLSELAVRVCLTRGLEDAAAIRNFLSPKLDQLTPPLKIRDMSLGAERVITAGLRGGRIRVFGDYDVDGTCGAALLGWFFRQLGWISDIRQPDRFKDGYGLNVRAVEEAAQDGVDILITVDCGITSFAAIDRAKELGLDVVVVDHHQIDPTRGLPQAYAVIDPQRTDCESGLRQVCGCGLAFYLITAIRGLLRDQGHWEQGAGQGTQAPNLLQHLDLVVIATAADQVPLTGDNRILVRHGMEILRHTKKPGVRALMESAGLSARNVSPGHLGFVLGPRINASGRMQSASIALELLLSQDPSRAASLALELEKLNSDRAEVQNQVWDEVRARVQKGIDDGIYRSGIVVADENWHEGVVGIVASRVTETFKMPAAVIAIRDGVGKGSVRTHGGKDVLQALRQCSELLLGFGGHRHAAGLSLSPGNVPELIQRFDAAAAGLENQHDPGVLWIEGSCGIEDLSFQALKELESLGPFGPGNPEPVFSMHARGKVRQVLKGRHLKLTLSPVGSASKSIIDAIWFHAGEKDEWKDSFKTSAEAEWAGVPELNYFRGNATPTLRIRDCRIKPSE